jgi:ketosteroid isomerase-like protein
MTGPDPADVQWVIDRLRIRDCLHRYTRGLDRHDAELIASAFWPDAVISYGKQFHGPLEAFVAWGNELHASRWRAHSHNVTNQSVEIDGNMAHVESYVVYFHRNPDKEVDVGVGRYLDLFERRAGEWRILKRQFIVEMLFQASGAIFDESRFFPRGRWDRDDLSYERPLDLPPVPQ